MRNCAENHAIGLRLLSLESPTYRVGPWVEYGNVTGNQFPTFIENIHKVRVPKHAKTICAYHMAYADYLLSF